MLISLENTEVTFTQRKMKDSSVISLLKIVLYRQSMIFVFVEIQFYVNYLCTMVRMEYNSKTLERPVVLFYVFLNAFLIMKKLLISIC